MYLPQTKEKLLYYIFNKFYKLFYTHLLGKKYLLGLNLILSFFHNFLFH